MLPKSVIDSKNPSRQLIKWGRRWTDTRDIWKFLKFLRLTHTICSVCLLVWFVCVHMSPEPSLCLGYPSAPETGGSMSLGPAPQMDFSLPPKPRGGKTVSGQGCSKKMVDWTDNWMRTERDKRETLKYFYTNTTIFFYFLMCTCIHLLSYFTTTMLQIPCFCLKNNNSEMNMFSEVVQSCGLTDILLTNKDYFVCAKDLSKSLIYCADIWVSSRYYNTTKAVELTVFEAFLCFIISIGCGGHLYYCQQIIEVLYVQW